jgi:hypothetical protein
VAVHRRTGPVQGNRDRLRVYNTALEQHLRTRPRGPLRRTEGTDRGKRPIREIVGVDPAERALVQPVASASRPAASVLAGVPGRPRPAADSPVESIQLAQQATLETREAKHAPRTLAEQRAAWAESGRRGSRRNRAGSR